MSLPFDPACVPDVLREVASYVVRGDLRSARDRLATIDAAHLVASRRTAMDEVWGASNRAKYPKIQSVAHSRGSPSRSVLLSTFQRDRFTCRYCGRRTIYLPVLRALSGVFPDLLPFTPNWRPVERHILYWTHSASLEHHEPLARGGADDASNFVTSCYQCNDIKKHYRIEEIGGRLNEIESSDWDGLLQFLPALAPRRPRRTPTVGAAVLRRTRAPSETSQIGSRPAPPDLNSELLGTLIRARLPGKASRRQYRVEHVTTDSAKLREMWKSADGVWVASSAVQTVRPGELEGVQLIRSAAPSVGARDE